MTTFAISTDALTTTVEADSADAAAAKFAAGEPIYAGCQTVDEVEARADELGGWANIEEIEPEKKTVEFCTNDEWMRVFGPLDCGIEDDSSDMTNAYQSAAINALRDDPRASAFEVVAAQGQRILCHGWNGAQFTYQLGGFGTYADLTDDEKAALDEADDAGRAAARKLMTTED